MVKKMPQFKFKLANTNGGYLELGIADLFFETTENNEKRCAQNFNFILTNETDLPFSDVVVYGSQYFKRYSSLEIDYDNMKIAFSGAQVPSEHKSLNGGTIALIVILVVVGVILIGTGVWWYLRRKNLPNHLNKYEQL